MRQLVRMLSGKLRHRSDEKSERGDTLLAIDDQELVHARGTELPSQDHDHRAREVRARASPPTARVLSRSYTYHPMSHAINDNIAANRG